VTVAIIDYGSGNLHSAAKAFERAGRDEGLTENIAVTRDPDLVARADRIVLPGVGAFADCRRGLDAVSGMVEAIEERVRKRARPFLGICVGMQLMAERGREYEVTQGLGWIAGEVDRIAPSDPDLKIPHMGWNTLELAKEIPLLSGINDSDYFYFVHSYYPAPDDPAVVIGETEYGMTFASVLARDNIVATQFHPEKSGEMGLRMYRNFLAQVA